MHGNFLNKLTRKIHAEQCLVLYWRWRTQQTHACFQLGLSAVQTSEPMSKTRGNTLLVLLLCNISYRDNYIRIGIVSWKNVSLQAYRAGVFCKNNYQKIQSIPSWLSSSNVDVSRADCSNWRIFATLLWQILISWHTGQKSKFALTWAQSPICSDTVPLHIAFRPYNSTTQTNLDLAAATQRGWSSETTPLPMGVGRKGSLHLSTKSRKGSSAPANAAPSWHTKERENSLYVYLWIGL